MCQNIYWNQKKKKIKIKNLATNARKRIKIKKEITNKNKKLWKYIQIFYEPILYIKKTKPLVPPKKSK